MKLKINKKIITVSAVAIFIAVGSLIGAKVWAAGLTNSPVESIVVTLTVDEAISITTGADVTMTPNISVTANSSIGSSLWNVKTNAAGGYTLAVKASADPALVRAGGGAFTDYTEGTLGTPELWSVASGDYEFGYSVYGTDKVNSPADYWGTGSSCGSAGTPSATLKYVGTQITDKTVSTRTVPTLPAGVDTTICFAAQQNSVYAPAGTYTATITATATTL